MIAPPSSEKLGITLGAITLTLLQNRKPLKWQWIIHTSQQELKNIAWTKGFLRRRLLINPGLATEPEALDLRPDELIDWTIKEDNGSPGWFERANHKWHG